MPVNPPGARAARRAGLPSSLIWLDDNKIARFVTLLSKGVTDYKRGEGKFNQDQADKIFKLSYELFTQRIKRRKWSQTAGGEMYGHNRRMTGRFYNGETEAGSAFRTVTFIHGKEAGFGFPNIPFADKTTNFVWRALEFGLPPSKHKIPPGTWFESWGGKAVQPERGRDDMFAPTLAGRETGRQRRGGESKADAHARWSEGKKQWRQGGGIEEKKFLRDAWKMGIRGLPKRYIDLYGRSLRASGWKGAGGL